MADNPEEKKGEAAAEEAAAGGGGGIKALLPLILTIVMMPVLAFVMTQFVIVPKLAVVVARQPAAPAGEGGEAGAEGEAGHGEAAGHGGGGHGGGEAAVSPPPSSSKLKYKVKVDKIVVNVNGSLGTRLLLASLTLAGNASDFESTVNGNMDMLKDLASSVLASKTISDLEKPEARNLLRSELISQFNAALGKGAIQEIYITELAIQ